MFGTRYYDPSVGRWTQQDAVAGSISDPTTVNWYAYVGGDPVNFVDPDGTSRVTVALGAVALVLGTAALIATLPATFTVGAVVATVAGVAALGIGAALLGMDYYNTFLRCGPGTSRRC
jgi:uncharacterized protein RhaS with RHS repeats